MSQTSLPKLEAPSSPNTPHLVWRLGSITLFLLVLLFLIVPPVWDFFTQPWIDTAAVNRAAWQNGTLIMDQLDRLHQEAIAMKELLAQAPNQETATDLQSMRNTLADHLAMLQGLLQTRGQLLRTAAHAKMETLESPSFDEYLDTVTTEILNENQPLQQTHG